MKTHRHTPPLRRFRRGATLLALAAVLSVFVAGCLSDDSEDERDEITGTSIIDDSNATDQDCVDAIKGLTRECVTFRDAGGDALSAAEVYSGCGRNPVDCYERCYDPEDTCVEMYSCLVDDCGLDGD
ncbi:MAG: hypothetical protein H6684_16400 [Deltaproteobacteria bacterium]|nr:hypothetical protein [Deltaproteobacteria bacterium]MCB9490314.1 hypothetical protein [Deltaproteobacteria bacterium]